MNRIDPKYRGVWEGRSPGDQEALSRYFLPHRSASRVVGPTRPRVIKWYCPFADQAGFASGHRYCINVYTGCQHGCVYCYAAGYEPEVAGIKRDFRTMLDKDLADLERFDVPAAPLHLSNSTDAFQPLEQQCGQTRYALERVLQYRNRFTTITVLTKNPFLAASPGYVDLLQALVKLPASHARYGEFVANGRPGLVVEVSLAFWRECARLAYDPGAPGVQDRIDGLRALHAAGIPLVLRVDPLFPRSPLPGTLEKTLADFGLPEAQTIHDLERLLDFAKQIEVRCVAYSAAKITRTRQGGLTPIMRSMLDVYRHCAAPGRPVFRSGSWRLPSDVVDTAVVGPFLHIARSMGVPTEHCMRHLIGTA